MNRSDVQQIGSTGTPAVIGAVRLAAARTGVDFDYLLAQARIESGLDPAAAATTSSARGLYQFTQATWLDTVRKHGREHGLGWAAEALKGGADAATRAQILALRGEAQASASMAAAYASDNSAMLEHRLGRAPTGTDLYLAHFLGPAGAARFLQARDADPGAAASGAVIPAAAHANAAIFQTRGGRQRSIGEVYDRFTAKLGGAAEPVVGTPTYATATGNRPPLGGRVLPVVATATAPQAARTAYLLLAELGA